MLEGGAQFHHALAQVAGKTIDRDRLDALVCEELLAQARADLLPVENAKPTIVTPSPNRLRAAWADAVLVAADPDKADDVRASATSRRDVLARLIHPNCAACAAGTCSDDSQDTEPSPLSWCPTVPAALRIGDATEQLDDLGEVREDLRVAIVAALGAKTDGDCLRGLYAAQAGAVERLVRLGHSEAAALECVTAWTSVVVAEGPTGPGAPGGLEKLADHMTSG